MTPVAFEDLGTRDILVLKMALGYLPESRSVLGRAWHASERPHRDYPLHKAVAQPPPGLTAAQAGRVQR